MLKPSHTARLRFRRFSVRLPRELGNGGLGYSLSFLLFVAAPFVPSGLVPLYLCVCMILYTLAEII
jgi:hypothetical protein